MTRDLIKNWRSMRKVSERIICDISDTTLFLRELMPALPLFFGRDDHIAALLTVRGDASRDMKQTIIETLDQGPSQPNPNYVPIFKEITVPTLTVPKLLK